ncbi:hypothetical protein VNI00_009395 [Paramarasmius palmivorus]|uniref:Uncharacterized protein n=1 Tax=Paramarasmius palmivorus TaxID=297713 RepID=A0AAW0CNR3_9AGAR
MATTFEYSAFFSSGLLAPPSHYNNHTRPRMDSTASIASTISNISVGTVTSTATLRSDVLDDTSDVEDSSSSNVNRNKAQTPKLRKRRSSLSIQASPSTIHHVRSPSNKAEIALGRRARSGSITNQQTATEGNSLVGRIGRMRSGSLGGALRPQRRRLPPPPAPVPAPALPLPPLPPTPKSPATPRRARSMTVAFGLALPPVPATPPSAEKMNIDGRSRAPLRGIQTPSRMDED